MYKTILPLAALWSSAYASGSSSPGSPTAVFEAWRVVCVALVTSPEFHIY